MSKKSEVYCDICEQEIDYDEGRPFEPLETSDLQHSKFKVQELKYPEDYVAFLGPHEDEQTTEPHIMCWKCFDKTDKWGKKGQMWEWTTLFSKRRRNFLKFVKAGQKD